MTTSEDLLTTREAADVLGRSASAVRNYVRFCGLPARKLGVQSFIARADLDAWRNSPANAAMLANGDHTHKGRRVHAPA